VTMKAMIRSAVTLLALLSALLGLAYPLAVTGLAELLLPHPANGSLLRAPDGGAPIGSALIGQPFTASRYFWGRPSATLPGPYNGAASGGANLGPTNPALGEVVAARIAALHAADPGNRAPIPADLVTASASGLDPHLSLAAALYQVERVARVRGLPAAEVRQLVHRTSEGRDLGLLGEPRVNVLLLNVALDRLAEGGGK
jgi:potassium-transporting ATPase KdpC subunit